MSNLESQEISIGRKNTYAPILSNIVAAGSNSAIADHNQNETEGADVKSSDEDIKQPANIAISPSYSLDELDSAAISVDLYSTGDEVSGFSPVTRKRAIGESMTDLQSVALTKGSTVRLPSPDKTNTFTRKETNQVKMFNVHTV